MRCPQTHCGQSLRFYYFLFAATVFPCRKKPSTRHKSPKEDIASPAQTPFACLSVKSPSTDTCTGNICREPCKRATSRQCFTAGLFRVRRAVTGSRRCGCHISLDGTKCGAVNQVTCHLWKTRAVGWIVIYEIFFRENCVVGFLAFGNKCHKT